MKNTRMTIARLHLTFVVGFNRAILGGFIYTVEASSPKLWFFESHPEKEYDEFYCACHGAD